MDLVRFCFDVFDWFGNQSHTVWFLAESHKKRLNDRSEQEVSICGGFGLAISFFRKQYKEINNLTNQIVVFN